MNFRGGGPFFLIRSDFHFTTMQDGALVPEITDNRIVLGPFQGGLEVGWVFSTPSCMDSTAPRAALERLRDA